MKSLNKIVFFSLLSLLMSNNLWAATPTTTAPAPAPAAPTDTTATFNPNGNAMQFGQQAGSIAGAAQACGQDITTFASRINEALYKLSNNDAERLAAMTMFQRALQQAQTTQMNSHPLPCSQIMQDYNNLPLMRPDYEQTVIPQLNPTMAAQPQQATSATNSAPAPTTQPNTATTAPAAQPAPPQAIPAPQANAPAAAYPNTQNPVAAALSPSVPQQQMVYSNTAQNGNGATNAVIPQQQMPASTLNSNPSANLALPPPPDLNHPQQATSSPITQPGASVINPNMSNH